MITVADGTGLVGHCCNHLLRRRRRNGILVLAFGLGLTNLGVATMGASAQTPANNLSSPLVVAPDPSAKRADIWFDHYRFRNGETLDHLRLHYATLGSPHRGAAGEIDNAVMVLHWTGSGGSALLGPEYIKALFDPDRPLDSRRYYLIFPDILGHGNSSKPSDGLRAKFPRYGYNDLVDLEHKLITETLGIKRLHAILGMSMGGMHAWQWAEAYPDAVEGVMPVVSLPIKVSGRNLLRRRMVIDDIRSDPDWQGGNYSKATRGFVQGYQLLRMMIDGVPHLQAAIPDAKAADDLLYSIEGSRDYDPEPALAKIKARLFALNFADDEFNPDVLQVLERLMPRVPHGRYVVQTGTPHSYGHWTMTHPTLWAHYVREFMNALGEPPPIHASD